MPNFRAWVEETRAGNFVVRHEFNGKRETDYRVKKTHSVIIGEKKIIGKHLANALCDRVSSKFYQDGLGQKDLTVKAEPLAEQFIQEREINGLSPFTILHNQNSLAAFLRDNAIVSLQDITREVIQEWKANLVNRGRKNATVWGMLSDIRTWLNWLVEREALQVSPFGKKILPRKNDPLPRYYTLEEYRALDTALAQIDHGTRLLCSLAHGSGVRKREGLQVDYEDIQWHDVMPELLLRKEITKGKRRSRTVPLEPETVDLIGSRKLGRLVGRTVGQIDHFFREARELAGIDQRLTIHGLRHTFIKNLFQNGKCSTQEAMRIAGQTSPNSMNIYGNFEPSHLQEIVQRAYEERKRREHLLGLKQPPNEAV